MKKNLKPLPKLPKATPTSKSLFPIKSTNTPLEVPEYFSPQNEVPKKRLLKNVVRRGQMWKEVDSALRTTRLLPRDMAAVELLRTYAQLIDEAKRDSVAAGDDDTELSLTRGELRLIAKMETKLNYLNVVSDLGPKMQSLMRDLGMTPRAREMKGATGNASGGSKEPAEPVDVITDITSRRGAAARSERSAARLNAAKAMDS